MKKSNNFVEFYDCYSGGFRKLGVNKVYIQGNKKDATEEFEVLFNRDPKNVSCECCGRDFVIQDKIELPEFLHDCIVVYREGL